MKLSNTHWIIKTMGILKTKSIQARISKKDGLRICIMRRIKPEYSFDMWIPSLSPTESLLEAYVMRKDMKWSEFREQFSKKIIRKNQEMLDILTSLLQRTNVTLLCWERSETRCHRRLIKEAIQNKLNAK